jgi:DNA invertase Pin-like site-specific DNA recombinase
MRGRQLGDQAVAACRAGDVMVVTKLDRLARWIGPRPHRLFNVLAMVAEFESDLIKLRTGRA